MVTTGKIANRTAVISNLKSFLSGVRPELVAPIFTAPKGGVDAQNNVQVGSAWTAGLSGCSALCLI